MIKCRQCREEFASMEDSGHWTIYAEVAGTVGGHAFQAREHAAQGAGRTIRAQHPQGAGAANGGSLSESESGARAEHAVEQSAGGIGDGRALETGEQGAALVEKVMAREHGVGVSAIGDGVRIGPDDHVSRIRL